MSVIDDSQRLSGDYRWLWEVEMDTKRRIVQSVYGTGEVETIGWEPARVKLHIIAATEALAIAAWQHKHGWDKDCARVSVTKLLRIDYEIDIAKSRCRGD